MNIVQLRLQNQYLHQQMVNKPEQIVSWLGAVQSQDYSMAKWSLGLRLKECTDAVIESSLNEGRILRTHIMRPTWHFVAPEDIRWLLTLTAPRVNTILAHYDRKLELSPQELSKCYLLLHKILENNNYLTRSEIGEYLEKEGIQAKGQRLGHIVFHAELEKLICSGPRKGKQFSYSLLEERVPKTKTLTREESLAKLATKYFTSHGPAQVIDFAWWSGLTMKDSREAIELVKTQLNEEKFDGKIYWFSSPKRGSKDETPQAFLLSIYDEYTIAYKDRSALGGEEYFEKFISLGNALTGVMIVNGLIVGTWKRTIKKHDVDIFLSPLKRLNIDEKDLFQLTCEKYGKFLDLPIHVSYNMVK